MFNRPNNPNSSRSLMLYRSSTDFKNRDAKTTVCQPFGVRCSKAQPKPLREASHFIRVSRSGLNAYFLLFQQSSLLSI